MRAHLRGHQLLVFDRSDVTERIRLREWNNCVSLVGATSELTSVGLVVHSMTSEILIVDDHPGNLLALDATLSPLGRTIVHADSGEAALKALLVRKFAVVLLDVQMRELDGFQTAALIRGRRSTKNLPIIFLTAYDAEFRQARRAYDLGAFDYIVKPFDPEILRHKVAAFVRLYEQEAQLLEASESARIRDVFIGILGHDLRNPLGTIQMATTLLERAATEIPERHAKNVARISRAAKRMEQLIEDVLDFTRGQLGGGIPVNRNSANLGAICQHIVEESQTANPRRQILLTTEGDLSGSWDAARLAQVVSNLVGNAVRHGAKDPVRVAAIGAAQDVRVSVSNPGFISEKIVARLFEPFRRGDDSSAGLGLGLYIVREIIRAHGGQVEVQNDRERCETVFSFVLPRVDSTTRSEGLHSDPRCS